jgi:hypothetical protein
MCCYKIMNKKPLRDKISDFTFLYFHFYSHYIKVYIYSLVKVCTFAFIPKKSATVFTFEFDSEILNIPTGNG